MNSQIKRKADEISPDFSFLFGFSQDQDIESKKKMKVSFSSIIRIIA